VTISKHQVVKINYTLKNDQGQVLDSSDQGGPLAYIHGIGHIIPGLEDALEGKGSGEKLNVSIPPEKAYGERNDQLVQAVPKTEFQDVDQLVTGMQFQVQTDQGPMILTVIEVRDQEVVLDGNHPLAGQTLHFDVEVLEIRAATQEELDHGHVHGEGGVEH
jgi:FKBP-type peptidyl-prolyl cis-trans isomerase SlyD